MVVLLVGRCQLVEEEKKIRNITTGIPNDTGDDNLVKAIRCHGNGCVLREIAISSLFRLLLQKFQ